MPEAARHVALSWGKTEQGPRANNEDTFHHDDDRGIYFVVDGMGGHAAGEEAAAIAQNRLIGRLERAVGTPEQRVREAITIANNAIFDAAETRPDWHGMACVLTVAIVTGGEVTVGHVGDSRLYRVFPDRLEKVTRDHSPVGLLEDHHEIDEADAMRHPRRNEVFRDVGSQRRDPDDPVFIDIYRFPFDSNSAFFICSDGLSDVVPSETMRAAIEENAPDRHRVVDGLIEAAMEAPKDNTTVVFVQGDRYGVKPPKRKAAPAVRNGRKRTRPLPLPKTVQVETEELPLRIYAIEEPPQRSWILTAVLVVAALAAGIAGTLLYQEWTSDLVGKSKTGGIAIAVRVTPNSGPRAISVALDRAQSGETIEIAPGEYAERIRLKTGVKIVAHDAVLRPPTDIGAADAAVTAENVEQASVSGLRIKPPAHGEMPVGIRVVGGRVDLSQVQVTGARRAGIEYSGNATGMIEACVLADNFGTGILIRESAAPSIVNNKFEKNGAYGTERLPGLHVASLKPVTITGNTFLNNAAEAIWQPVKPTPELLNGNSFGPNAARGAARNVRVTGPLEIP